MDKLKLFIDGKIAITVYNEEEFNRVSDEFIDNSNSEEETHEQIDFILSSQFC